MKTILAPIDFSESATSVINEAVVLARAMDARLILLHVIQPLPGGASENGFAEASATIAGAAVHDAVQRLAHVQRQLSARHVTASTLHTTGIPGAAIVARAREVDASFIVIGSHGHGALYELIVGGTASRVIREAACPVVVVPSRACRAVDLLVPDQEPIGATEETTAAAFRAHR